MGKKYAKSSAVEVLAKEFKSELAKVKAKHEADWAEAAQMQEEEKEIALDELREYLLGAVPPLEVARLAIAYAELAKAYGFVGRDATIKADRAVRRLTGQSPLSLLGG